MNQESKALVVAIAAVMLVPLVGAVDGQGTLAPDSIQPELADQMMADSEGSFSALFVFEDGPTDEDVQQMQAQGLVVHRVWEAFRTAYASGTGAALLDAAAMDDVVNVVENQELEYYSDTATLVTNAREVWDQKSTSTNPVTAHGEVVDGTGVGIAIVDSGVDGDHPDLAPAMAHNARFICSTPGLSNAATGLCYGNSLVNAVYSPAPVEGCTDDLWVPMDNTDIDSGHGTHVASTAAGRGYASDGRFMGSAPGASIFGFGAGDAIVMTTVLESFHWILCHHDTVFPQIKIVSNSWGVAGPYDPSDPINVAVDQLVTEGLTVLFAAGNDGSGSGSNAVNTYARSPTPGVIGVANYDDGDIADTSGDIDGTSSTCSTSSDAWTCPDVSAPGTGIVAARASTGLVVDAIGHPLSGDGRFLCCVVSTLDYSPHYVGVSGTSMSTPQVAGIAALLLDAESSLSPADVEDVLEDTAVEFTSGGTSYTISDPDNGGQLVSYEAGHGLVNATAALGHSKVLNTAGLGSLLPDMNQGGHVYIGGVDAQLVSGVQWTTVSGLITEISERLLESGDTSTTPLTSTTPCRFVIFPVSGGTPTTRTCQPGGTLTADTTGWRMDATYAFPAGDHVVEAQLDVGNGFVAFDAFTVRAR